MTVQETLDQLIRERGEDYASLSRFLGRNAAYIQQFIRRGSPRKLDEADRRKLARYFGVDETVLGGPVDAAAPGPGAQAKSAPSGIAFVQRLRVAASAGPGALVDDDAVGSVMGFEQRWLRSIAGNPAQLSVIQVEGDSMEPTLANGDDILVDRGDAADRVRDGVYVLRVDGALLVKRLAVNPVARRVSIRSDNLAYPDWDDCDPASIDLIGRVVWVGRKLV
jgi:phage repressor protein C with HTH and peptisase S24 domain